MTVDCTAKISHPASRAIGRSVADSLDEALVQAEDDGHRAAGYAGDDVGDADGAAFEGEKQGFHAGGDDPGFPDPRQERGALPAVPYSSLARMNWR